MESHFKGPDGDDGGSTSSESWSHLTNAGMGAIRVALLFGSAAVAFALILTPQLDQRTRDIAFYGVDPITTSSVDGRAAYTVRRSILQSSPRDICIIHADGARSGSC